MAYDYQKVPISIPFVKGLDTKMDEKLVPSGNLLNAQNIQYKNYSISKIPGFELLSNAVVDGTFINIGRKLLVFNNELLLITDDKIYTYSETLDRWVEKGDYNHTTFNQDFLVFNNDEQLHADGSYNSGVKGYVWEDSRGGVRYSILDHVNNMYFVSDEELDASGIEPQVVSQGMYLYFFYNDAGSLYYRRVSITEPTSITAEALIVSDLHTTNSRIQIKRFEDNFIGTYVDNSNDIKILYITQDGDIGGLAGGFPDPITIAEDPSALCLDTAPGVVGLKDPILQFPRFIVAWQSSSGVRMQYLTDSFLDLFGGIQELDANTANISNITATHYGTNESFVQVYYEYRTSGEPQETDTWVADIDISNTSITAGVIFYKSLGISSQAFRQNEKPFVFLVHESKLGLQNSIFLISSFTSTVGKTVIGKVDPGEAGGLSTKPLLPKVLNVDGINYIFPSQFRSKNEFQDGNFFSTLGLKETFLQFCSACNKIQDVQIGDTLYVSGAITKAYDGERFYEAGFNYYPEGLTIVDGGGEEVQEITFDTFANTGDGDGFLFHAQDGTQYAAASDKTGASAEPTGSWWTGTSASNRVFVDVSGATTAADMAALFETDINTISGLTAKITTDDSAADGTLLLTQVFPGLVTDPTPHDAPGTGVGTITVAIITAGVETMVEVGVYNYSAVYRFYNNKGELERSSPATQVEYEVTDVARQNIVTVPTYRVTEKVDVIIEIYRTPKAPGNTISYLIAEIDNDETVDTISYTDNNLDSDIISNEPLYTTGNILENGFFTSSKALAKHQNRLFVVPMESQKRIKFSKRKAIGSAVEIVDEFFIDVFQSEEITGIRTLDTNLIISDRDNIHLTAGEGPDETGAGLFYTEPQEIHFDVGSLDGIIAKVPDGLIFKTAKGIYLLTRGMQPVYIGQNVERFNDLTITSAVLVDDENEVRFTTQEGETLYFNYLYGEWSSFVHTEVLNQEEDLGTIDSIIYNGDYVFLSLEGRVYRQNKTTFQYGNRWYGMDFETAWIKPANILAGIQRIAQCNVTGTYKSAHFLQIQVAYDYEDAWVDTYYFDTSGALADGLNFFGSDPKFGLSNPVFFKEAFNQNRDNYFNNEVIINGGPITVENNAKSVYGTGSGSDELGFYGEVPFSGGPLEDCILEHSVQFGEDVNNVICLSTCNLNDGLDYITGISILFRTFTNEILMLDAGFDVGDSNPFTPLDLTKKYTCKYLFNSDGSVSCYVSEEGGTQNHLLGTSSTLTNFTDGPIFFEVQQTSIDPEESNSIWDDIYFHKQGLTFDPDSYTGPIMSEVFGGVSEESNVYNFRFFLSRPKCSAVKFRFQDIVNLSFLGEKSGESLSITELMLMVKQKRQPKKFSNNRTVARATPGI